MVHESADVFGMFGILRNDFIFNLLHIKNILCIKLDLGLHEPFVDFKDLDPEIDIKEKNCNE